MRLNDRRTSLVRMLASLVVAGLLAAVSGCGSDGAGPSGPRPGSTSGNVNKAPVVGASLGLHTLTPTGAIGTLVAGPYVTDAGGNWSGSIPISATGPFAQVATGGSYTDEATSATVQIGAARSMVGLLTSNSAAVTPFTHATWLGMMSQVSGGATLSAAILQATSSAQTAFGFDFASTIPLNATVASQSQKKYAALLGGVSTLLNANPALNLFAATAKADLVLALAADMADGQLDGLDTAGGAILVPTDTTGTSTAPFPALSASDLSALLSAANSYAATQVNLTGITFNTATAWNPANPGGTGTCQLTFGGTGAPLLPDNCFNTSVSRIEADVQQIWEDHADSVQVLLVPVDGSTTNYRTVYVSRMNPPFTLWNIGGGGAIPGITRSGSTVTFNNVSIPELSSGGTTLVVNGTLPAIAGP